MANVDLVKAAVLSGLLATALIIGCSENECPEPYCCIPDPTLDNVWPNGDQTAWTYEYVLRTWDFPELTEYDDIDSVPPAPTMDEIEDLLGNHPIGDNPESVEGIYRLKFDGDTTTAAGVTAQYLTEMLVTDDGLCLTEGGRTRAAGHWHPAAVGDFDTIPPHPLFLRGGVWEKTSGWIGTYGELDTLPDWKFLEANLTAGHEFTFELPWGDAVLHCRILRRVDFATEIGVFEKAIECLYLLDPGILTFVGEFGDPYGWARTVDYGVVVYAPTVGPVYSYRRMFVQPGDPPSAGAGEVTLSLIAATTTGDLAHYPGAGAE
jgi:hypothetical protein